MTVDPLSWAELEEARKCFVAELRDRLNSNAMRSLMARPTSTPSACHKPPPFRPTAGSS